MRNLELLYTSYSEIPSKAANSIHVMEMANSFSKVADNVLLTAKVKSSSEDDLYSYYGINPSFLIQDISAHSFQRLASWISAFKTLRIALKEKPNIIYGRSLHSIFLLSIFGFRGGYESHSTEDHSWLNKFLFRSILKNKNIKYIIFKSEALKEIIIENFGSEYNRKLISFHDGARLENTIMPEIKLRVENKINIGYVGHLYKGRGIDLIINLAKNLEDFIFHIVGGNDRDVNYWKNRANGITNIHFYGFIEPKFMCSVREEMDILIAPYENQVSVSGNKGDTSKFMSPLKVFEYMSAKKPIVTSDHKVLKEVLTHGLDALLISVNDYWSWHNTLKTLAVDRQLRDTLGQNAYKSFLTNYTWDIRAQKIYNLLSER